LVMPGFVPRIQGFFPKKAQPVGWID
jgi:hypothetical protein